MIYYHIESGSGVPAYLQLMRQISAYIAAGTLKEGDKMPSVRNMAKLALINPGTVSKAYSLLANDGVLRMEHGRGVFVEPPHSGQKVVSAGEIARTALERGVIEAERAGLSGKAICDMVENIVKKRSDNG